MSQAGADSPSPESSIDLRRALVQRLESLQSAGVQSMARPRRKTSTAASGGQSPRLPEASIAEAVHAGEMPAIAQAPQEAAAQRQTGLVSAPRPSEGALPLAARLAALEIIQQKVRGCTRCSELAETRTQTVFGIGTPEARLCFLGEAPGADEDRLGEPFVGRAGQLLTKIIEACSLKREEVYILNVLKCRPPGNRTPLPTEVTNCREYLEAQLEIIRPEFICCLGAVAARALLDTTAPIGKLRGKFFDYQGAAVLCTYHPSYLLRNPAAKKDVWEDMQLLMRRMGIELKQAR